MADILHFPVKGQSKEHATVVSKEELLLLDRLKCKLIELQEAKEAILREIRITRDMIKLLEKGEK